MRVFVGLMLVGPDGAEARAAEELVSRVRESVGPQAPVRVQAAADLHLTLFFAGEVSESLMALLARGLEVACAGLGACDLRLTSTGTFPPHGPPKVLWAGLVEHGPPRLEAIQRAVTQTCVSLGLTEESRPWRPHVTLARVRGRPMGMRPRWWRLPPAFLELDPGFSWKPSHVALVERMGGGGPRAYRVLGSFPLEGTGGPGPPGEGS